VTVIAARLTRINVQTLRTWSRILLMVLVAVHIVTWYVLGVKAVGSIGIEAFFVGLSRGVINAGFVFWMLVLASALLLGRAFCGWFCWFGGYQELVAWGLGDRFQIKMPRRLLLYLGVIPFVSLGLKVYSTWLVNWLAGVPTSWSFDLANVEPWGGQQTGISILITAILYGPVLMFVFGRRAWCRHLCPIGALLRVLSRVRPGKVRLVNDRCIGCGACTRACDMEIDVLGELQAHGEVRSTNCIVCFKCSDECTQGALAYTLRRTGASLSPAAAARAGRQTARRRKLSAFDVTIAALWMSVVLAVSFAGLRDNSPQEIKVLMTPGLLLIFYGLALLGRKLWAGRSHNRGHARS
jgi:ferredoxin-type protein NapH